MNIPRYAFAGDGCPIAGTTGERVVGLDTAIRIGGCEEAGEV